MAVDTKPNLSSGKFEQCVGDILSLSGETCVFGTFEIASGGTISILSNKGNGKVLTSNSSGTATWQVIPAALITGATNGLSIINRNICLGGALNANTEINIATKDLHLCSGTYLNREIVLDQTNNALCLSWTDTGNTCGGVITTTPDHICLNSHYDGGGCAAGIIVSHSDNRVCLSSKGDYITYHNECGFHYVNDYSLSGVTNRWLPDKGYVDSMVSGDTTSERITKLINQTSHGFAVKDVIGWSGGTYNKAIANGTYDGEVVGIVSKCYNANCFDLTQAGYVTGLTGFVTNTTYFLSDTTAGLMTTTEPTTEGYISRAVFIANSATSGWVLPYAGYVVTTGSTGSVGAANNGLNLNGNSVELGGALCKNTTICGACYNLCLGTSGSKLSTINVHSTGDTTIDSAAVVLVNAPSDGTCTDKVLVWNSTTCEVNKVPYVSGATTYTANSPATCTVGGITPGYVLVGKSLECILQDAIAPYIPPTFSAFDFNVTSPIEVGAALSGTKTFTWTTTTSANVCTNSIGICEVGGSLLGSGLANDGSEALSIGTKTNTTPTTWTWQITGRTTQNGTFNRNVAKCSIYPAYYGKLTSGSRPAVTNSLVTGGTKTVVNSTGTVTVTFGSSASEYTWLAIPATSTSKTCWYRTALDNGRINNQPSDKYPDECVISVTSGQGCWSGINYKVYMSGAVGEITTAIEFRNS